MNRPTRIMRRARGFTLLEITVVVALTGLIMAVSAPLLQEMFGLSRRIHSDHADATRRAAWTSRLRADLWSGAPVTIEIPGRSTVTVPGTGAPIRWTVLADGQVTRSQPTLADPAQRERSWPAGCLSAAATHESAGVRLDLTTQRPDQPVVLFMPTVVENRR